jgi:pSer/pThr/pTyr-binding forkhead associated (FHA) protein
MPGAAFCASCGARAAAVPAAASAPIVCPSCGADNPPETNFCGSCGVSVHEPLGKGRSTMPERGPVPGTAGARLVAVRRDGTDGPSFPIEGDQIDLGRTDGDLRFDDPHLAARHVRLARRPEGYVVLPLDTRNGVYVRVTRPAELTEGDHLLLGKQVLRFEHVPELERSLRPAVEQGVVLFGTPVKPPWGRLRQMTAAGTTRDVFHLTRSETTLGREQGDLVFSDDEFMSRRHAVIRYRAGRAELEDLGSSNGTYVRLRGPHPLASGEMLRLGDELLRFELL